jgi:hypothetical protein
MCSQAAHTCRRRRIRALWRSTSSRRGWPDERYETGMRVPREVLRRPRRG